MIKSFHENIITKMNIPKFTFFIILLIGVPFCSIRFPDEYWALSELSGRYNNFGIKETRYYIRTNDMNYDSTTIIKDLYSHFIPLFDKILNQTADSVGRTFNNIQTVANESRLFLSYVVYENKMFTKKRYKVNFIYSFRFRIFGVWSFKVNDYSHKRSCNRYSRKVIKNILLEFPSGEFIGSKIINDKIRINNRFWGWHPRQFWKWFQENEETLYNYDKNREVISQMLGRGIERINSDLRFSIGPIGKDDKRNLKIILRNPYLKEKIFKTIPSLERWTIEFVSE